MKREKINNISTEELIKYVLQYKQEPIDKKIRIHSRELIKNLTIKSKKYDKLLIIDMYRKNGDIYFIGKFYKTGYINNNIHYSQIKTGNIKDLLYPITYNIGYLGADFNKIVTDKKLHKKLYIKWRNMLARCYDKTCISYNTYGKLGITVDRSWHCYTNYYKDVIELPGYNRDDILDGKITLDKDKFQQNKSKSNMIYSKNTCCWLSVSEQNKIVNHDMAQDSLKSYFVVKYPNNEKEIIVKGIGNFARINNLDPGDCSRAINGHINHVKGFKFRKATLDEIKMYDIE